MPKFCLVTLATILFINLLIGFIYLRTWRIVPYTVTNVTSEMEIPISTRQTPIQMPQKLLPHPHPYNFTLNSKDLCSNAAFSLLILVCSSIFNYEQRKAIRETWGTPATKNNNKGDVRLAFLVGSTSNQTQSVLLRIESSNYSDIIQENFIDSYNNLTLKSVMLLKWVKIHCPRVRFIFKTDDDMYVNVQNLLASLERVASRHHSLFGILFRKAKPNRDPSAKWYVPKSQFRNEVFPDYLSGTGYAMTRDSVDTLYNASLYTPFLVMEDVYITGLCAQLGGIKRYGMRGFTHGKRPATGCAYKTSITGHHVTPKDMRKIWTELQKPNLKCKRS